MTDLKIISPAHFPLERSIIKEAYESFLEVGDWCAQNVLHQFPYLRQMGFVPYPSMSYMELARINMRMADQVLFDIDIYNSPYRELLLTKKPFEVVDFEKEIPDFEQGATAIIVPRDGLVKAIVENFRQAIPWKKTDVS